jgi:hypothetical protein
MHGGNGGAGLASSITGSSVTRAGGGGGGGIQMELVVLEELEVEEMGSTRLVMQELQCWNS